MGEINKMLRALLAWTKDIEKRLDHLESQERIEEMKARIDSPSTASSPTTGASTREGPLAAAVTAHIVPPIPPSPPLPGPQPKGIFIDVEHCSMCAAIVAVYESQSKTHALDAGGAHQPSILVKQDLRQSVEISPKEYAKSQSSELKRGDDAMRRTPLELAAMTVMELRRLGQAYADTHARKCRCMICIDWRATMEILAKEDQRQASDANYAEETTR